MCVWGELRGAHQGGGAIVFSSGNGGRACGRPAVGYLGGLCRSGSHHPSIQLSGPACPEVLVHVFDIGCEAHCALEQ